MQCKEWDDANSELFKEPHDEAVHKNSYKSRLCELISASLDLRRQALLDPGPDPSRSAAAFTPLPDAPRSGGRECLSRFGQRLLSP